LAQTIKVCAIAAMGQNRVIGRDGDLPWRLSDDLKFFKAITSGKPLIVGRKTWESFPRRPLPGRENIVLSRDGAYAAPGARVYSSLAPAINVALGIAEQQQQDEVFIAGGGMVYERAMAQIDRLYLTRVEASPDGDALFPEIDLSCWTTVWEKSHKADAKNDHNFIISCLDRKQ
jgi:dihydrofolate reductase